MHESCEKNMAYCEKCANRLTDIDHFCMKCEKCNKEYSKCCLQPLVFDGVQNDICYNMECRKICFTHGTVSKCCRSYIINNDEGFDVCIGCGFVVGANYSQDFISDLNSVRESEIIDIYHNNFISPDVQTVSDEILNTVLKKNLYIRKNGLYAYCIYTALIIKKNPRPINEIEHFCGADKGSISKIIKKIGIPLITNDVKPYCSMFIDRLNLPFSWNRKTLRIINHLNLENVKPNTLCAMAIFILSTHMTKKRPYFIGPSLLEICNHCSCSVSTVKTHLNKLTKSGIINI